MKQLYDELDSNDNVVASGIRLLPGMLLPTGHRWESHVPKLDKLKQAKKAELENRRNYECFRPTDAVGYTWQADKRSQDLLSQSILLADIGATPVPPSWRTLDNQDISLTLEQLKSIAAAIAYQTQVAYQTSWNLKALVDAASTTEDLKAITWT